MATDDDFDEYFEATEESVDLGVTEKSFSEIVVAPADWTIGSLYAQIGKQIDLDPEFQRRNVWTVGAKSKFIESLFLGIPIPQILLSARQGQKNSFLVLDGKQRLLAIKEFLEGGFRLKGLRVIRDLEGKKWSDIEPDVNWRDRLLNETQRTAVIRSWRNERVLYEIFYRLNSNSVKLSPMELRMSLHPGPFLKAIIAWTEEVSSLHRLIGKSRPDPRMADVELSVRYLAFKTSAVTYAGDLKGFLDETCQNFNERFDDKEFSDAVRDQLGVMLKAIEVGLEVFDQKRFCRKFIEGKYENRFNRAVFDVQVGALSDDAVRRAALENPERFRAMFEGVSESPEFRRAVEATTKTPEATRNRFQTMYNAVERTYGIKLRMPEIKDAEAI